MSSRVTDIAVFEGNRKASSGSSIHNVAQGIINSINSKPGVSLSEAQITAIDRFVRDCHGETNPNYTTFNIWANWKLLRGNVGGTAASHAINWCSLGNNERIYVNDPTGAMHSANGISGNGSTQYIRESYSGSGLSLYSTTVGYFNTDADAGYDYGCYKLNPTISALMLLSRVGGAFYGDVNDGSNVSTIRPNSVGFCASTRISDAQKKHCIGETITLKNENKTIICDVERYSLAVNADGAASAFATRRQCFVGELDLLATDAQLVFLSKSITALQTALSRA